MSRFLKASWPAGQGEGEGTRIGRSGCDGVSYAGRTPCLLAIEHRVHLQTVGIPIPAPARPQHCSADFTACPLYRGPPPTKRFLPRPWTGRHSTNPYWCSFLATVFINDIETASAPWPLEPDLQCSLQGIGSSSNGLRNSLFLSISQPQPQLQDGFFGCRPTPSNKEHTVVQHHQSTRPLPRYPAKAMLRLSRLPWGLALASIVALQTSATPSVNVDVKAAFPSGPYLLELLYAS